MSPAGTYPYLYRRALGAWLVLGGGMVAVLLGLLSAAVNLVAVESSLDWRSVLLLAFGGLCLHVGVGSLRGQNRDAVRRSREPATSPAVVSPDREA